MSDYVMKLQQAMKQQSQDLRDELEDLKNWQSQIKGKSEAVSKKHENHKKSEVFNAAAGSNIPPIRYTAAASSSNAASSSTAAAGDKSAKKMQDMVTECKDRGNAYFQRQQFEDAVRAYTQGLDADPTSSLCPTLYANRALCNLRLQKWDQAEKDATSSINLNRTNAKAFYRRALARKQLNRLNEAKSDLDTVQVLVPGDADSAKELIVVNKMIVEKAKTENKNTNGSASSTSASASASPKRKKLVIQEVSDEEDEDESSQKEQQQQQDEDYISPEEQKKRDEKLRAEMKAAEERQAAERRQQAAKDEAARNRQRKMNSRVEIVDEDDDVEEPAPKISVQTAASTTSTTTTKQHQDPMRSSASPQPAASTNTNSKPASTSTAAASSATTTATKSASPPNPRKLNVQVFTSENMPNPDTYADFERIYREISKDLSLLSVLVEKIVESRTDAQIAQLFGSNLTNEMLTSILQIAAEKMSQKEMIGKLMKGLSQLKRIDDLVMFMESGDSKLIKAALDKSNLSAAEKSQVQKKLS